MTTSPNAKSTTRTKFPPFPKVSLGYCLMICVFFIRPTPGSCKTVEATKVVTWLFDAQPPNNGPNSLGQFKWNLFAMAKDDDGGSQTKREPANGGGGSQQWTLNNGLALQEKTTGIALGDEHPEAESYMSFAADAASQEMPGERWFVNGYINTVVRDVLRHHNRRPAARAKSLGKMTIRSGVVVGGIVKQPGKKIQSIIRAKIGTDTIELSADTSTGQWKDPMTLELRDLTTGVSLFEDLYDVEMDLSADAELDWASQSDGVVIETPADGDSSARISIQMMSSWITNYAIGESHVLLEDGFFEATGIFENLPWVLTYSGLDVVKAELGSELVPTLLLEYDIPDHLVTDGHLYQERLNIDSSALVAERIPEPATAALVAVGMLIGLQRRRIRWQA